MGMILLETVAKAEACERWRDWRIGCQQGCEPGACSLRFLASFVWMNEMDDVRPFSHSPWGFNSGNSVHLEFGPIHEDSWLGKFSDGKLQAVSDLLELNQKDCLSSNFWLVVWNMVYCSKHWEGSSQLTFIFFRGVAQPPARNVCIEDALLVLMFISHSFREACLILNWMSGTARVYITNSQYW